jgi:N-acetylglucosamine-6-phosphate deacetylase
MHIHAAVAVINDELRNSVCVQVEHGLITLITESCSSPADKEISGTLVPGFVDIHSHGGAGYYFSDTNIENVKRARQMHLMHGTTSLVASLVTEPIGILEEQIRRLAPLVDSGVFAGIHLEGPYLSEARCGAHQPSLLRDPALDELGALLDCAGDTISMVTLAPERDGGVEATQYLTSRGVTVALGHSQADAEVTKKAIGSGAALITHFSNGMPKPKDGNGTIASQAIETPEFPLELILDGIHVNDETLARVKGSGKNRTILVTDAMSAAGAGDGKFTIGALAVTVVNGVARLDSNGSLAGSTLTMDVAFKNYFKSGATLIECVQAASTLPAKVLGFNEVGSITVGKRADLLEVTSDIEIRVIEASSQSHA